MIRRVQEKISVITVYNHLKGSVLPVQVRWHGRIYHIKKLGYHHKVRMGRTMLHVFSVCNDDLALKLQFNSDTLEWVLEEVSDGLTD